MIQIRMQQGLSQDARIIRQEVFVEEQGFHHEFDENRPDGMAAGVI